MRTLQRQQGQLLRWRPLLVLGLLFLALGILLTPVRAQQPERGEVILLTVEGPVTPAMGSYLKRGLQEAEEHEASLLILRLDTPGGSVEVMGQLVRQLSNAEVPTLVYVWPSGGRAASAGTFITLSADLAAMAPQTTIGAAAVVSGGGQDIDDTMSAKVTNDLVAAIRSQTARRGEEAQAWAERAIREAVAANADEALEIGIIDFIARDLSELLQKADGAKVELETGEQVTLNLATVPVREIEMNLFEAFLHVITDPNIALMLISLGGIALFYEFTSPGGYIGAIFGIIAILLGFYALGSLDANWAGLGLILFAFILFLIELQTATTGLFAAGGIIAFIFGTIILFQTSYRPVSLHLVVGLSLAIAAFFVFALAAVMRTRHRPSMTGKEGLIGTVGEARTELAPDGKVFVAGEIWKARSPITVPKGARVRVTAVKGINLEVEPVESLLGPSQPASQ